MEEKTPLQMTRRELLQWISLSSGMVFLGPLSGCNLWRRSSVVEVDQWHRGVCRFCGIGCTVQIGVKDGKLVDIKGDKDGHNKGRLCIKGTLTKDLPYVKDRALYPMIRKNGKLEKASWEEAMGLVASKFKESIDKHGPDSVAFYGSGQLYTQESYTANKLFKAGIRTNNVDGNPRLCMASAVVGYISVYGKDEPLGCYEDIDHAHCFFITGSNTMECHPIIWERIMDRKRSHPETFIIVVDPRTTKTAQKANMHLKIIPGTDVTLYNSMMYEFVRQNFIDQEMVEKYLSFLEGEKHKTFEDFKKHLEEYKPERAAQVCGISPREIQEAAYYFGASKATMSLWTMGINQQYQGSASNRLLNAMNLLTGHVGKPGATPLSLTGQPNACGGVRDTGSLAHALPNGRVVANPKHRAEMEKLWEVPAGTIKPKPGYHAVALFEAMEKEKVKCCLVMCTNPAQSLPNAGRFRKAMEKPFLVVAEAFYPTETTEFADVVLPTGTWVEKEGVFGQTERRYQFIPKLINPPGEARSDLEILVDLAERLGHGKLIKAKTAKDVWDEWRKISAHSAYNFEGITYERLQKEPGILWPCPNEKHPGTNRRYIPGEDPLAKGTGRLDFYGKPDKKATIWIHHQEVPQDPRDEKFPFILTTGRILEHWHTMTMTGAVESMKKIHPDYVELNSTDARKMGIKDGEKVIIKSRQGQVIMKAWVNDVPRPGVVFSTFHSAKYLINLTTKEVVDPFSKEPEYKSCAVTVEPYKEP